jgi:hypothetical protein
MKDRCYAITTMANQQEFQEQGGKLQKELEAAMQIVIFYPSFIAS